MANEKYTAKWYDPLTGAFTVISDSITAEDGMYKIPEKPNSSDWALIVTSRTDLGGCRTAPLPQLELNAAERSSNVLSGAKAKASSYSNGGSAQYGFRLVCPVVLKNAEVAQ